MAKIAIVAIIAVAVLAGAGAVSGQPFTFSHEHGQMLHQHATAQHHDSYRDPHFHAQVGAVLPGSVQVHPLPDSLAIHVPQAHQYGYGVVNDRPVIVDHSNRRVLHSFD